MYTSAGFMNECLDIFRKTEGNTADIPGIGGTLMYEEPLIGFASAEDRPSVACFFMFSQMSH